MPDTVPPDHEYDDIVVPVEAVADAVKLTVDTETMTCELSPALLMDLLMLADGFQLSGIVAVHDVDFEPIFVDPL